MKTILEFLLSKKDNKIKDNDYYIVWPVGRIFYLVADKFDDNPDCDLKFIEPGDTDKIEIFILSVPQILDTIETLIRNVNKSTIEKDFRLYKIPNGYDEQSIKDAIKTYKVDYKNLERVNIDDLK